MKYRLVFSAMLLLTFAAPARAQNEPATEWHTIAGGNGEFSIAVPTGYIVNRDEVYDETTIVGGAGGASFEATFRKTSRSVEMLEWRYDSTPTKGQQKDYLIGDARVRLYTFLGTKIFRMSVTVAARKGYYSVSVSAPARDNPTVDAILAAIQLNQKPMVKESKVAPPGASSVVNAERLKSSEVVRAALKRKQTTPVIVEALPSDFKVGEDQERAFSRRLMIVKKPRTSYTDKARSNSVTGTVQLRVLFRADGNIGKISVIRGLRHGLTEEAIAAAKGIKFLPAEINGVPVDDERTIEYGFSIY